MNQEDIQYLCTQLGMLSGIPVRLFQNETQIFFYSMVHLPADPMKIWEKKILSISDPVGYFVTEDFYYFGILNFPSGKIVVGPTRSLPSPDQSLKSLAFRCDLSDEMDIQDFINGMKSIVRLPVMNLLQMLLPVSFALTGKKLTLQDLAIQENEQGQISESVNREESEKKFENDLTDDTTHNSYDLERLMIRMVQHGDMEMLKKWMKEAPAIRPGQMAPEQLRQLKDTFIVSATLVSRAAIQGGLPVEDAFQLSDAYIQKAELLPFPDRILNLQFHMILDFCDRVSRLRENGQPSDLVLQVRTYVLRHISDPLTTESIAKALYMSRSYLSRKYHAETGETLLSYIHRKKIEEAKRMLIYTSRPLTAVSAYLGFSSQGHFSRIFREYTGMTPAEYRKKPGNG